MEIERHSGLTEKQIVTAMILDPTVLAQIVSKWNEEEGMFSSKWANIVGGWCVRHFKKYKKAPKSNIQGIFETWSERAKSKESVETIEEFLLHLSKRAKRLSKNLNPEYSIDLAKKHFNEVATKRLIKDLEDTLENDGAEATLSKMQKANRIEIGQGSTISLFKDKLAMKKAGKDKRKTLIEYPGEAGLFFGNIFERDSLVAFMAPEKTGKSFWLLDVAYRAAMQGKRTAVFQVGDLSQNQIMRRFMSRIGKCPTRAQTVKIPTMLEYVHNQLKINFKDVEFKNDLDYREVHKKAKEILKSTKLDDPLRLEVHSMNTISVNGIRSQILHWSRSGWVPDVVVIDYADILAPLYGGSNVDSRQQVNATWQALRGLGTEFHSCIVTATQTNAASYDKEIITRSNFSEDKRKNAHVTALMAINQTDNERTSGVQRINIVQLREDFFSPTEQLLVAGCFGVANPIIKSLRMQAPPEPKGHGRKNP